MAYRREELSDDVTLYCGDCLEVMAEMEANSIDSVITDPPYGLQFMGKDWDKGVPGERFWIEALKVSKPGAMLLSFGGTRTYHRLVTAIEDAGWDVQDMIMWLYGSGFPKSHDVSKAIDREAGAEREVVDSYEREGRSSGIMGNKVQITRDITAPATPEAQIWDGWGTALKPAVEPICVATKARDGTYANNALTWGVAGLWIDGSKVGTEIVQSNNDACRAMQQKLKDYGERDYKYGIPGENAQPSEHVGRWPANVIHDGSDEVMAGFPQSSVTGNRLVKKREQQQAAMTPFTRGQDAPEYTDSGSAARFFYCAKASRAERNAGCEGMEEKVVARNNHGNNWGEDDVSKRWLTTAQNNHPTVKPVALMEYLAKLTKTPTGGVVLDPFMGSGTTGIGCVKTGRPFVGIELDEDYFEIAIRRILHAMKQVRMPI